jgi:hypothetical protein
MLLSLQKQKQKQKRERRRGALPTPPLLTVAAAFEGC